MKIFHADTDDIENPLRGGQPVRTFEINRRLALNHQVEVYTATYPGCRRERFRAGIQYRSLGLGTPQLGLSYHMSFLAAVGPRLWRSRPDIVVEEFTPPVGFCLLPLWTGKPVVSIVQWYFFQEWERRYKLPFEKIMRTLARRVPYTHFIVQSKRMGQLFKTLIPHAQVSRIPCGIPRETLLQQTELGEYALFLGRLDIQQKGLDILLDVWEGLAKEGFRLPLRIAGAGPDEGVLARRIQSSGLSDCVELLGRVEGSAKQALLRACRFLVMPSRVETFGLTALEAMAVSKPVVAFDIDHLNELVAPGCGVLIPPGDTDRFARTVRDLWFQPQRVIALGLRSFDCAKSYLWERLAEQQETFYRQVVKEKGSA